MSRNAVLDVETLLNLVKIGLRVPVNYSLVIVLEQIVGHGMLIWQNKREPQLE